MSWPWALALGLPVASGGCGGGSAGAGSGGADILDGLARHGRWMRPRPDPAFPLQELRESPKLRTRGGRKDGMPMIDDEKAPDFSDVEGGSSSTVPASSKSYTIMKGDTLSKIAHAEYGEAKLWRKIFEHNKDVIKDPDKIYPGQVITLPPKEELVS
jgi:nucleoid-associated protein YgaU